MTRFRNVQLGAFRQYQNIKTILKKNNMGQNRSKKWPDMTYSKEVQQKMKILDKLTLRNI